MTHRDFYTKILASTSVFLFLILFLSTASAAAQNASSAGTYAYITNIESHNVSVIDTSNNTLVTTIPAGVYPYGVAVSSDGLKAYVANQGSNTVSVINTTTNEVSATVDVGKGNWGIAVSPDGTKAYVTNYNWGYYWGQGPMGSTVSVMDTVNNTISATVTAGNQPCGIVVSPDGSKVYVTNSESNDVSVINAANNTVISTIPAGNLPWGVAVSPDGTKVYVANCNSNTVSAINTSDDTIAATIPVGVYPYGIAVSSDGSKVYVTNFHDNTVSVINTTTNSVVDTVYLEKDSHPHGISFTPDGKKVYVASQNGNVYIINTADNKITATVQKVGLNPIALGQFIKKSVPISWEFSPQEPVSGDLLNINGNASPGEKVGAFVTYDKAVPVSEGKFEYTLEDVKIPEGFDNLFTVEAKGAKNLNVRVKMVLWATKSSNASGDTATVSQSNVPPGTYKVKIDGDAGEGVSEVNLKITAFQKIKADSNGNFSYSYNTTEVPTGNFEVKIGDVTNKITLRPEVINVTRKSIYWEFSPQEPVSGDLLNINGSASSGEKVGAFVTYDKAVPVSEGKFEYTLEDVKIPEGLDNLFTVEAKGAKNLNVRVKMVLWATKSSNASGDTATVSQSNVLPGTYKVKIDGDAGEGVSEVNLKITAFKKIKADSNGNFSYSYNTTAVPPGNFEVKIGDVTKEITLLSEETEQPTSVFPISNFSSNITEGYAPLTVQFIDLSENATYVSWDFGDRKNSTERNPVHKFTTQGTYTVNLTANNGNSTDSKSAIINVTRKPIIWEFSPQEPVSGDLLNINGSASPGEKVDAFVTYEKSVPVLEGKFEYTLEDVKIPEGLNSLFTVEAKGAKNLNVRLKTVLWATKSSNASGDTAIVSQSNVLPGTYKVKIDGNAGEGVSEVNLKITAFQKIKADSNGNFSYSYNTTAVPPGNFEVKVGDITKEITLRSETIVEPSVVLPVADFSIDATSGYSPLTVQFKDLSKNATEWYWDFGDGTTSTEQNPVHTFDSYYSDFYGYYCDYFGCPLDNSSGVYFVKLTAINENGQDSKSERITTLYHRQKLEIAANFFSLPDENNPLSVHFFDDSIYDTPEEILNWDFGDGTTSDALNPIHTYPSAGNYTVTLTLTGKWEQNTTTSQVVSVTDLKAPVANFSASSLSGASPLNITFTDRSTGLPTSWQWDFGDGTNSDEQNPKHNYSSAGNYTVNLTAANYKCTDSKLMVMVQNTTSQVVSIKDLKAPVADFSASSFSGVSPLNITFTDKSTGLPTSWQWDFGDGTNSADQNPVHIFSTAGNYTVNLTATNQNGTDSKLATINVVTPPVIPPLSIDEIRSSPESAWIKWTWNNPHDSNFDHTELYLNGTFQANTSAENFNTTDLQPETDYTIGTRTADVYGNVNETWVNASARTKPLPDTAPPIIEYLTVFPVNTTAGSKVDISANITDNIGVAEVTVGNVQMTNVEGNWEGNIIASSSVGKHSLLIKAKDSAGNTVSTSVPYSVIRRQGSVIIEVLPTVSNVVAGKNTNLAIKVKNTQNIDDTFKVEINNNGLLTFYQAGVPWFSWTEKTVNLKANQEVLIPVEVKIPAGTATGFKLFRASVSSETSTVSSPDTGYLVITRLRR